MLRVAGGGSVVVLAVATVAAGQAPVEPRVLFEEAAAAIKEAKSFSYTARWEGDGYVAARMSPIYGDVVVERGLPARRGMLPLAAKVRIDANGDNWEQDGGPVLKYAWKAVYDGKRTQIIDEQEQSFTEQELAPGQAANLRFCTQIVRNELINAEPFAAQLAAPVKAYLGQTIAAGEICDIVYIENVTETGQRSWWYLGSEDRLPRKVVSRVTTEQDAGLMDGGTTVTITNLKVDVPTKASMFELEAPEGYWVRKFEAEEPAPRKPRPELLAVGLEAPDFELADPDGEKHKLSDYRGKVVLLDFWSTWCGPCKRAMPGMQALHEKYRERGLVVIGLNTWEAKRPGDPPGYMEDKGFTYQLLMKADDVAKAYNVSGIPTFYVIGTDGKIVHRKVGAGKEDALAEVIEEHLPKRDQ